MNKAEKLKQKAYRKISNYVGGFWVEYHFNEKELQLYADEQSRETIKLLEISRCPNFTCDNNGTCTTATLGQDELMEPEPEQCEWCFNRKIIIDNWYKKSNQEGE